MPSELPRQFTVSWDPKFGLMMIQGPRGFTQFQTTRAQARAIADIIDAEWYVSAPGTTLRPEHAGA